MVSLAVTFLVAVVVIVQEKVLVGAVDGKRDRGGAESGKGVLETVRSGVGSCVSPSLAVSMPMSPSCQRLSLVGILPR